MTHIVWPTQMSTTESDTKTVSVSGVQMFMLQYKKQKNQKIFCGVIFQNFILLK